MRGSKLVAGLCLAGAGVLAAQLAPAGAAEPGGAASEDLSRYWDGPTVGLDWRGRDYATASGAFLGPAVLVPGDRAARTLNVRNDGPGPGLLTVRLAHASTQGPDSAVNWEFEEVLTLNWRVGSGTTFRESHAALRRSGRSASAESVLAAGQVVPVRIGYELPAGTDLARAMGEPSVQLAFDVLLTFTRAPAGPGAEQVADQGGADGRGGGRMGPGNLGATGLGRAGLLAAPVILLAAGLAAVLAARRERMRIRMRGRMR
ncbi:MAG: hypothetical protein LBT54_08095 [Bifidobacteriaceae bacterium]|jgi:hypothetical protein|nr:hypothetical protein [Bifidobacteriaceae bacterium]